MTYSSDHLIFTLDDVKQSASAILDSKPDAIIAYRLLREVLRVPQGDAELAKLEKAALTSKWVVNLEVAQQPDGSWGRFHSQDTKAKTTFRTTEEAIDRAFALGFNPNSVVLTRAQQYILDVLHGHAHITDRFEKHAAWPLLVKLFLAGRLAQIDPSDQTLVLFWVFLEEVAEQAFASGNYRLEDEATAYLILSGILLPQGFLESQHALWILSAHNLPGEIDHCLVDWIWHKPNGVRYLRASLENPHPRQIGYWLRSMNILSRFASWRDVSLGTLNGLWNQRDEQGLWDFGSDIARIADFPISDSWRKANARKQDYSTCILALLRKYFD
jgi:hypothetical protein